VFCTKKGSGRPTKRIAENIEEVEQRIAETPNKSIPRLIQETYHLVQFSFFFHFFPYRVSVVHEIKPLDNKSPHNITSLNIDHWFDL
jgi:hypothetical protein